MKILITGVGGPTPRSFATALRKYSVYKRFELIGTDTNPLAIGLYQNELFNHTFIVPPAGSPDYWPVIEKLITEQSIDMAVILPEAEVIEWSKKKAVGNLPCKALIPDNTIAELLVNKSRMTDVLRCIDMAPLSITFTRDIYNADEIFDTFNKGFWVRSTTGTSGLGALKIENKTALRNWIEINPNVQEFMASQYLPGRNLACKVLYYEGAFLRAACCERMKYIMAKVAPSGITGNVSYGRLINDPLLVQEADRAMNYLFAYTSTQKHGFFTVDLKEDENGKPYITEVNIRHIATTQCFAAGGANFALDTIRLLDGDTEFNKSYLTYEFEKDLIFLRDVDSLPILMKGNELLYAFD
ncbi:hypothetical protein [Emticicia sp. TH156]|uniref:hypothetical protein n=1 Tax=Emticicia sp. TH156 TaxID=2067454 RepID=UPI001E29B72B|nr:hypothetical protein [Emticicia sp. TH156]